MSPISPGIDWDEGNRAKCQMHGVSIGEIEAILLGHPRISPDLRHSGEEDRLIAVGRNDVGRAIFVAFTVRRIDGQPLLRPVSARYMHSKEAARYATSGT